MYSHTLLENIRDTMRKRLLVAASSNFCGQGNENEEQKEK